MSAGRLSLLGALLLLGAAPVQAQIASFEPNELSFDAFGFTASRDKSGADKQAWGPGVGLNYFFTEFWGLGLDTYADAFEVPYLLNGSALFRYPLDDFLAPYAFAGFGRQWDHAAQWLVHAGVGLDFRVFDRTSLFADVRGVFPDTTKDYALVRFGVRFTF